MDFWDPQVDSGIYFSTSNMMIHADVTVERNVSYLANGCPFKLLEITFLVGKIKFKLLFQDPLAKWVKRAFFDKALVRLSIPDGQAGHRDSDSGHLRGAQTT